MAYIYPPNNSAGVHLTVFDFTLLSPPPITEPKTEEPGEIQTDHKIILSGPLEKSQHWFGLAFYASPHRTYAFAELILTIASSG